MEIGENKTTVLGLIGGIASGKSLVAEMFVELGAGLLDADRAGHAALELPHVQASLRERFSEAVFLPDGGVNRPKLAQLVFPDQSAKSVELTYLEQLVHPEITRILHHNLEEMKKDGIRTFVLDAPLLIEAGWDKICDVILFVEAERSQRLARAMSRGWSEAQFSARESAQDSLDLKRSRADEIIDNSKSPQFTRVQVERLWQKFSA